MSARIIEIGSHLLNYSVTYSSLALLIAILQLTPYLLYVSCLRYTANLNALSM